MTGQQRLKLYLTVRECAELAGEVTPGGEPNTRRMRRRLERVGALVRLGGFQRLYLVPTSRLRELDAELHDRALVDSRYWEGGCRHPQDARQVMVPGVAWCRCCGGHDAGHGWVLPASATPPD